MTQLIKQITALLRGEEGVTAIEYAVVAALMLVVIMATIGMVGTELFNNYWALIAALP